MPNELFNGLDNIIFDQPETLNVEDFNKTVEDPKDLEETEKNKTPENKSKSIPDNKSEKDKGLIDPNDFFNKIKETEEEIKNGKNKKEDLEEEDKTETPKSENSDPKELYTTWADYFKENNLLVEDDLKEFDGSIEGLVTAFQARENRVGLEMVDDYKNQVPPLIKHLMDNWEEGVPLNELVNIKSNQIRYSAITDDKLEESVDTQKSVYAEYLRKTTKYSETKIEKEITRLTDLDELKVEAIDSLKELKKFEAEAEETLRKETKKEQEARKIENANIVKQYQKVVSETKEIIPGLKLDEKIQKDVLSKITNPIGIDGNGNPVSYINNIRNEDPYKFDTAITYLATLTKGFTDWSKVIKTVATGTVKDLENKLNTSAPKSTKDGIKTNSNKSLLELLEKNKGIFNK